MEDVKKIGDRGNSRGAFEDQPQKKKKGIQPAAKVEQAKTNTEAVSVAVSSTKATNPGKEQVYKILGEINQAVRNTDEITSLVEGIAGIVSQAAKAETMERLNALEFEARDLAAEVAKIASHGIDETKISHHNLSDHTKKLSESFGKLSEPAQVLSSQIFPFNDLETARKHEELVNKTKSEIESLSENIRATAVELKKAMEIGETVVENNEASFAMVRDVDAAIEMAQKTSKSINADPKTALAAIGESKRAPDLIK